MEKFLLAKLNHWNYWAGSGEPKALSRLNADHLLNLPLGASEQL